MKVLQAVGYMQYQIRSSLVNAPRGSQSPAYGFGEDEPVHAEMPPLTEKAATAVDELLQLPVDERLAVLQYLARAYPRSLGSRL